MDEHPIDQALEQARMMKRLPAPAARKQLRENVGLTQLDLSRALGVTRECVPLWEQGKRTPRPATAERYLALLDRLARESLK